MRIPFSFQGKYWLLVPSTQRVKGGVIMDRRGGVSVR